MTCNLITLIFQIPKLLITWHLTFLHIKLYGTLTRRRYGHRPEAPKIPQCFRQQRGVVILLVGVLLVASRQHSDLVRDFLAAGSAPALTAVDVPVLANGVYDVARKVRVAKIQQFVLK